jgi:hypothetical protein
MKQPILVVMEVPEGTDVTALGTQVHDELRLSGQPWEVLWTVPLHYTIDVPEGAISG